MQKKARETAKEVNKIQADVKKARGQITRVYRDTKSNSRKYAAMISKYRKSLRYAEKSLTELEMAIQIDRDYDKKLADLGKLPKGYRTISGLNRLKVAKIKTSSCRVREFPSESSRILGAYVAGKSVDVRYHSSKWNTLVYGGEKAFLSKSCFN